MKTAKITKIIDKHSFEGKFGTSRDFKIELDNGDVGKLVKKTEDALKEGDELTYDLVEGQYGYQIKVKKSDYYGNKGGNSDKVLLITKAMECSTRLVACGDIKYEELEKKFNEILSIMKKANE